MILLDVKFPESCSKCIFRVEDAEGTLSQSFFCLFCGKGWIFESDVPTDKRLKECPLADATNRVIVEENKWLDLCMQSEYLHVLNVTIGLYCDGMNATIDKIRADREEICKKDPKNLTGNDTVSLFQLNTMLGVMQPIVETISKWREKDPIEKEGDADVSTETR